VVVDAFHGFKHADAILAGFYRALRPGGKVAVLTEPPRWTEKLRV
jgi:ubiquinone/menaquinone biosynthesis C-methylase UbiE